MKLSLSQATVKTLKILISKFEKERYLKGLLKILALLNISKGHSVRDTADYLNESPQTISNWLNDWLLTGFISLQPVSLAGRPRILNDAEVQQVLKWLKNSPEEHGFLGGCWTARRIQSLILQRFGKHMSLKYIPEYLRTLGLSYQKATLISEKRNEDARTFWKQKYWPKLMKRAKLEDAEILFGDESHLCVSGYSSRTWAPRGHRPEIKSSGDKKKLNVIGAVGLRKGSIHCLTTESQINSEMFISFLKTILKENRKKVYLILDNARVHKSNAVKNFLAEHRGRIEIHFIPTYSPDLNPAEGLWSRLKTDLLANLTFSNMKQLKEKAFKTFQFLRSTPQAILNLFNPYLELVNS